MKTFKQYLNEIETRLEFHDTLNQKLWDNEILRPPVKVALNKIAKEFIEFLGIPFTAVDDVIITGSNCAFSYSSLSDIDLHLVLDMDSEAVCSTCSGDFVKDCFQAKKTLWNSSHDITIYGYDIELYPQKIGEPLVAAGVYSLTQDKWLKTPEHKPIDVNNPAVKAKAEEIALSIDGAIETETDDVSTLEDIKAKIRKMRQAGLEHGAENSVENLAFKTLRNNGYLDKLSSYTARIKDKSLSLE